VNPQFLVIQLIITGVALAYAVVRLFQLRGARDSALERLKAALDGQGELQKLLTEANAARVAAEEAAAKSAADLEVGRRKFSALEQNAFWRYENAVNEARLKYQHELAQLKGMEESGLLERAQDRWIQREAERQRALKELEKRKGGE
jgi:hypothetical protein